MTDLGVIEGFYGQPWPDSTRLEMLEWLSRCGFSRFLFAPKNETYLRSDWRDALTDEQVVRLRLMQQRASACEMRLYVGLSPYEAYEQYDTATRRLLFRKLDEIGAVGITSLAVLFDDMSGRVDALAARQLEIVSDIRARFPEWSLAVCPTYYSDDPVLDRVFGQRPVTYLEDFAAGLEADIEVFWTGPAVCSPQIEPEDLATVAGLFGDRLALWDNYPVNDSALRSTHLYIQPIDRDGLALESFLSSHWCNAMNQGALSLPALISLALSYRDSVPAVSDVYREAGITPALLDNLTELNERTFSQLPSARRSALEYLAAEPGLAATELADWIAGKYRFDPDCLTG